MATFAACVAVWQGWVPKANSGLFLVDRGRVRVFDSTRRLLGDAAISDVRYAKTRFAWGAVTVYLGHQRFVLSQGGADGVPGGTDGPDLSLTIEAVSGIMTALERAGATPGRKPAT